MSDERVSYSDLASEQRRHAAKIGIPGHFRYIKSGAIYHAESVSTRQEDSLLLVNYTPLMNSNCKFTRPFDEFSAKFSSIVT